MAQALYRKWRPTSFDEVVGQEHVVRTLRNALTSGRIHHAYLFAGPRGTGKTTTARLLAKAVNCLAPEDERPCNKCEICHAVNEGRLIDLIEIDAASNTGVDDVRELRERVGFRPNEARYKVYVIDEVHMLSNAAFNALLKTLEEPPEHAIFVLATTEPQKIPDTVLSRCQRFDFRRIPVDAIVDRLAWMTEQEGIEAEREALTIVARQATGSMRDAESLLDRLLSYGHGGITVEDVTAALGTGTEESVLDLTGALIDGDVARGLEIINSTVEQGADPRQFARQIVRHLRSVLLMQLEADVPLVHVAEELRGRLEEQASAFSVHELAGIVRVFNDAAVEAKGGWQPQLPLELAFIEAVNSGSDGERIRQSHRQEPVRPKEPDRPRTKAPVSTRRPSNPPKNEQAVKTDGEPSPKRAGRVAEENSDYLGEAGEVGSVTVPTLQERWPELLDALRPKNLSLEALMRSCKPVAVEDDVIVLGFAHGFHRDKVDESKRTVEDVLSEMLGQHYRVRCTLLQGDRVEESGMAARSTPVKEQEDEEDSKDPLDDPVVRVAVEDLGATVIERNES